MTNFSNFFLNKNNCFDITLFERSPLPVFSERGIKSKINILFNVSFLEIIIITRDKYLKTGIPNSQIPNKNNRLFEVSPLPVPDERKIRSKSNILFGDVSFLEIITINYT